MRTDGTALERRFLRDCYKEQSPDESGSYAQSLHISVAKNVTLHSFTFHEPDGSRLLGFDNAHPVPHSGGRYVKPKVEADHWHRTKNDEGRTYTFVSAAQLLDDFFAEVERICEAQGISTEVVDEKETYSISLSIAQYRRAGHTRHYSIIYQTPPCYPVQRRV